MTQLRITPEIFQAFPEVVIGVVVFQGVDNSGASGPPSDIAAGLRVEEAWLPERFAGVEIAEHEHIAPWREAYRKFGAKPKETPSSIENLVRRILKGHSLTAINPLVDLYNTISLRHLVPVGGEDLDSIQGDVVLAFAGDAEAPVRLLGEAGEKTPKPGEVIYKDDLGTLCRRWNWKEAERTKLTASTQSGFLVLEGLPPVGREHVERAVGELADLVRQYCGGSVKAEIVDSTRPEIPLG